MFFFFLFFCFFVFPFYIENGILCVLIRIASLEHTIYMFLHVKENQRDPYYASGAIINSHWLELLLSRTNFHGPKGVRAIEVRLYVRDWGSSS